MDENSSPKVSKQAMILKCSMKIGSDSRSRTSSETADIYKSSPFNDVESTLLAAQILRTKYES